MLLQNGPQDLAPYKIRSEALMGSREDDTTTQMITLDKNLSQCTQTNPREDASNKQLKH